MDFNDPNSGTPGGGMAQNPGAGAGLGPQLNWQAAYQQYASDEQSEGRQPLPMDQFVAHMSAEVQRRQQQGLPVMPEAQVAQAQAQGVPAPAQGLGLARGLYR